MAHPWLSVVMPTYNGAAYLRTALASVVAQRDRDIEVIAVDDGSADDTVGLLRSFADRVPLSVTRRPHSGNWVASTNHGLSLARGDWVCFLHQDDYWLPDRLSVLKGLLARAPDVAMLLHPTWYVDSRSRRLGLWRCPLPTTGRPQSPAALVERLLIQNFIAIPAPLFRREAATRLGGLDARWWYAADWDFWLGLAASGAALYTPRPLAAFRIHPLSQTMSRTVEVGEVRGQLHAVLDKHLAAWGQAAPGRTSVRRAARFSAELNASLAGCAHGQVTPWPRLVRSFLSLGPEGWGRYLQNSRVVERVGARIADGLHGLPARLHDLLQGTPVLYK